ncbi:prepilin peptidase [Alicyclobacillus fodiniaquatilis]|uniref:Prepilin peptidase n=1 Tax=Alicyclobacillus fodiniaquatilis TaxID=1661150 RepID=A0ABW4JIF7_9BACL
MWSTWIEHAVFGDFLNGGWWSMHCQVIWITLLCYGGIAGWYDLRTRRIPNICNLTGLIFTFSEQWLFGTGASALFVLVITGVIMLIPTSLGLWGQGDWKLSMVYGVSIGFVPTLLVWLVGILLVKLGKPSDSLVRNHCQVPTMERSIPVGLYVAISGLLIYLAEVLLHS